MVAIRLALLLSLHVLVAGRRLLWAGITQKLHATTEEKPARWGHGGTNQHAPIAVIVKGESNRKIGSSQGSREHGGKGDTATEVAFFRAIRKQIEFIIEPLEHRLKRPAIIFVFTYCDEEGHADKVKKGYGTRTQLVRCLARDPTEINSRERHWSRRYGKEIMEHVVNTDYAFGGMLFLRPDITPYPEMSAYIMAADLDHILFPFANHACFKSGKTRWANAWCVCPNGHDRVSDIFQWIPASLVRHDAFRKALFGVTALQQVAVDHPKLHDRFGSPRYTNDLLSECALDAWASTFSHKSARGLSKTAKFGFIMPGDPPFSVDTNPSSTCKACLNYDSDPEKQWNPLYYLAGRKVRAHNQYVTSGTPHMFPAPEILAPKFFGTPMPSPKPKLS